MDKSEYTNLVAFERGIVLKKKADAVAADGYVYKVKSSTRDEIITRWIEAMDGEHNIGDKVHYAMFADGRGFILWRIRTDLK